VNVRRKTSEPRVLSWDDDTMAACSEVVNATQVIDLIETLSQGRANLRLEEMRDAVAVGDLQSASRLEAEAKALEEFPALIQELADEWRRRSARKAFDGR
jgi:hypothetical protein